MLVIEQRYQGDQAADERLVLPFELRCRSRLRARLESGEEAGLFLEPGTALRGGDRLLANDGRVVEVVAAPERLMEASCGDSFSLARLAYHLGNRHVAVEVRRESLRFEADPVLKQMLLGLGATVEEVVAPFEPEAGAYGHGHPHAHSHSHGAPASRIHQYRR